MKSCSWMVAGLSLVVGIGCDYELRTLNEDPGPLSEPDEDVLDGEEPEDAADEDDADDDDASADDEGPDEPEPEPEPDPEPDPDPDPEPDPDPDEPGDELACEADPAMVPPAVVDCDTPAGYEVSSTRTGAEGTPRLWVGGVYQTRDDHSGGYHPVGDGHVQWDIAGDNVLVLSSYEPTDWVVELGPGASLSKVIVVGYHAQTIQAPAGVETEALSYETGGGYACGYSLPGNGGGCEGEELVAFAEAHTGLTLAAFDGCYDATQFHYAADCSDVPDPEPEPTPAG